MRVESFQEGFPGRLVPVSGISGASHAFIPAPLPPAWTWPDELWSILLEAHKALAELDGTGKHLPSPELILRPLQYREAQKSSSLEGTYTEPEQQLLFEMEPEEPVSREDPANARREVSNYARALRLRRDSTDDLPLSLRLVRQLHEVLMSGVRGGQKDPGRFRRVQNQIGRPARFVPPPANHLPDLLDNWEKYLHTESPYDQLVNAFIVHYQFEAIHPFLDGNGRVGRLLLAITVEEWCRLSNQWLYMSAYFDRNRDEYIGYLERVSTEGAWGDWIRFCLQGVAEEARDTLKRCDRLIALQSDFHERARRIGGSVRLFSIIDNLFILPVTTVTRAAEQQRVTYPTARSDLKKLEEADIVRQMRGPKQITYMSAPILQAIYYD